MKKSVTILTALFVLLVAMEASALTVVGFSNPFYDPSYDFDTSSSTPGGYLAEYTFNATAGSFKYLSLDFRNQVFMAMPTLVGSPAGWTFETQGDKWVFKYLGSTPVTSLTLVVNYNLQDTAPNLYSPVNYWDPGLDPGGNEPWEQDYVAAEDWIDFGGTIYLSGATGGSTTLTPEPGTLILFGSGLIGIGAIRRKLSRRKKKSWG